MPGSGPEGSGLAVFFISSLEGGGSSFNPPRAPAHGIFSSTSYVLLLLLQVFARALLDRPGIIGSQGIKTGRRPENRFKGGLGSVAARNRAQKARVTEGLTSKAQSVAPVNSPSIHLSLPLRSVTRERETDIIVSAPSLSLSVPRGREKRKVSQKARAAILCTTSGVSWLAASELLGWHPLRACTHGQNDPKPRNHGLEQLAASWLAGQLSYSLAGIHAPQPHPLPPPTPHCISTTRAHSRCCTQQVAILSPVSFALRPFSALEKADHRSFFCLVSPRTFRSPRNA